MALVFEGTFTSEVILGEPRMICTDISAISPTPTEFLDIGKLEQEGDDDDAEREGDEEDVNMADSGHDWRLSNTSRVATIGTWLPLTY